MAASTVTRATWTDDDGSGLTGTILNNARLQADVYDKVDEMLAGSGSYAALTVGGRLRAEGGILDLKGVSSPSVSASGDARIAYDSALGKLVASINAGAFKALGQLELLKANSGTDTSAGATNVDTYAMASGLTAKDRVLVFTAIESATQQTAACSLYNSTDSVVACPIANNRAVALGDFGGGLTILQQLNAATKVLGVDIGGVITIGTQVSTQSSTFTTNWTGAWTLALRHGGVTAGGTFKWSWAVFVLRGQ